jgi:division protein CdvB (Snf7/Vps24/ESCRT-III family)
MKLTTIEQFQKLNDNFEALLDILKKQQLSKIEKAASLGAAITGLLGVLSVADDVVR